MRGFAECVCGVDKSMRGFAECLCGVDKYQDGIKTAPPKLIIAGAPASGKGTQCELDQAKGASSI